MSLRKRGLVAHLVAFFNQVRRAALGAAVKKIGAIVGSLCLGALPMAFKANIGNAVF